MLLPKNHNASWQTDNCHLHVHSVLQQWHFLKPLWTGLQWQTLLLLCPSFHLTILFSWVQTTSLFNSQITTWRSFTYRPFVNNTISTLSYVVQQNNSWHSPQNSIQKTMAQNRIWVVKVLPVLQKSLSESNLSVWIQPFIEHWTLFLCSLFSALKY